MRWRVVMQTARIPKRVPVGTKYVIEGKRRARARCMSSRAIWSFRTGAASNCPRMCRRSPCRAAAGRLRKTPAVLIFPPKPSHLYLRLKTAVGLRVEPMTPPRAQADPPNSPIPGRWGSCRVSQSKNPSPPVGLGLMGGLFGRLPTHHCVTSRRKNTGLAIWFRITCYLVRPLPALARSTCQR